MNIKTSIEQFYNIIKSPFFRKLKRGIYYAKCKLWYKYNVVKLSIPPTWQDKDFLIETFLEKMLIDFVEKEKPFEHFETKKSPYKQFWRELNKTYFWFKETKPVKLKEIDDLQNELFGNWDISNINKKKPKAWETKYEKLKKLEEQYISEFTGKLLFVVSNRHHFWT